MMVNLVIKRTGIIIVLAAIVMAGCTTPAQTVQELFSAAARTKSDHQWA